MLRVTDVPDSEVGKYGIAAPDGPANSDGMLGVQSIRDLVEEPLIQDAPSRFASIRRYILTPDIFTHLKTIDKGHGGELQLADAIQALAGSSAVCASSFQGERLEI